MCKEKKKVQKIGEIEIENGRKNRWKISLKSGLKMKEKQNSRNSQYWNAFRLLNCWNVPHVIIFRIIIRNKNIMLQKHILNQNFNWLMFDQNYKFFILRTKIWKDRLLVQPKSLAFSPKSNLIISLNKHRN